MTLTIPHTENLTKRFIIRNRNTGLVVASYSTQDEAFEAWASSPAEYEAVDMEHHYHGEPTA